MKRALITILIIAFAGTAFTTSAQKPRSMRERQLRTVRQSQQAEQDRALEDEARLPEPKPAVLNVDVQLVLSKVEYKTFAEAKASEAKKVADGEPLWLYAKFKTRLGDYVVTTRSPDDPEKLRYTLFAEVAPRGDITALSQYSIQFAKEDLMASEIKLNLAPGLFGRNRSIPVLLMTLDSAKTGVWNNEVRLANTLVTPRALTENLASVPVTFDLAGGVAKYRKMGGEYGSITLRGTLDKARMPVAGTFFSQPLSDRVTSMLATENIRPHKLYFSGDDWEEFGVSGPPASRTQRIFAVFTYQREATCLYGIAELVKTFDFLGSKYGEPEIRLQKDLPIPCTDL